MFANTQMPNRVSPPLDRSRQCSDKLLPEYRPVRKQAPLEDFHDSSQVRLQSFLFVGPICLSPAGSWQFPRVPAFFVQH